MKKFHRTLDVQSVVVFFLAKHSKMSGRSDCNDSFMQFGTKQWMNKCENFIMMMLWTRFFLKAIVHAGTEKM